MFSSPHTMQMVVKQEQRELVESLERKRQFGMLRGDYKNRPLKRIANWLKSR